MGDMNLKGKKVIIWQSSLLDPKLDNPQARLFDKIVSLNVAFLPVEYAGMIVIQPDSSEKISLGCKCLNLWHYRIEIRTFAMKAVIK